MSNNSEPSDSTKMFLTIAFEAFEKKQINEKLQIIIKPDLTSTIGIHRAYLRRKGIIVGIYLMSGKRFITLTERLIKKHSK